MFSLLPTSLLALLFASPALAAPTTPNDLFHAISAHAPKQPDQPICCLRPLTPLEPSSEEDILLSFEDWKAKRASEVKEQETAHPTYKPSENLSDTAVAPDLPHSSTHTQGSIPVDIQEHGGTQEHFAPQLRIPLVDRFNYASLDCSARVHAAHKSAKSASSILSSKKDRYMLSPCEEQRQYVIVELCEDIRIDTVQLANYEFFSGVFKDFSVSVAKRYPPDPDGWTFAGTYRAKNARGVQSFHPPPTLRDFYRVIRIDFHSHYGSEYYCPVSLLRVYGLTHLEEWQWETWEAETRAKRSVEEASHPVQTIAEPEPAHSPVSEQLRTEDEGHFLGFGGSSSATASSDSATGSIPVTSDILASLQYNIFTSPDALGATPKTAGSTNIQEDIITPPAKSNTEDIPHDSSRHHSNPLHNTPVSLSSTPSSHAHSTGSDNHSSALFIDQHTDTASHLSASTRASSATPDLFSISIVTPSYVTPAAPPVSTGGESIYRTIMNRLTALEGNTTLYARYVEEQTAGMREVLRRLTEDIGRLEGIGKAQAQLYHRSVGELEKQARRLESEQRELLSRVNYLTDEVILEKRLGIAQLCLLLTVLVFMALTRGSRGEYAHPPGARGSVQEWGRRTLSFSGDLVNRFRTRSSTPPRPTNQKPDENGIPFPSADAQIAEEQPRHRRTHGGGVGNARVPKTLARPHTPTSSAWTPTNRHFVHHRAGVPVSPAHHAARPGMQRSSSGSLTLGFGGIGPVPKSAKRWARSAHLHEVKAGHAALPRRQAHRDEATPVSSASATPTTDVFDSEPHVQILTVPAPLSRSETVGKGKGRMGLGNAIVRQPSPLRPALVVDLSSPMRATGRSRVHADGEGSEGDAWVDTDVSGSECDSVAGDTGLDTGVCERTYNVPVTNSSL